MLAFLRPTVEDLLQKAGIPVDLRALEGGALKPAYRTILGVPIAVARIRRRRVLVFFDELQRVVDYEDGEQLLGDLMDLYAGSRHAVVLVDGSDERTVGGMLGAPVHFGKLVDRLNLSHTIPATAWRKPLTERFARAGLSLHVKQRDQLIGWGGGRPYETMAVARHTAFAARKLGLDTVTDFDVQMGIDEARRRLDDDGA